MRLRSSIFAPIVLLALGSCGTSDSREATLRLKPKVGDSYTVEYHSTSKFSMPPGPDGQSTNEHAELTLVKEFTCEKVESKGVTWKVKTTDAKSSGVGQMAQSTQMMAEKDKGKLESIIKDDRNKSVKDFVASPIEFEYPMQAVHVGDAWRAEVYLQGYKLLMMYKVEGFEKVDGMDSIVISGTAESSTQVEDRNPLRVWIDISTGLPIKGKCGYLIHSMGDANLEIEYSMKRKA